jgi:ABC-type sugar transport system permease subunit
MKKDKKTVLLFVLPAILIFTFMGVLPLLPPLYYSLFHYKMLKLGDFVGFENYISVLKDPALKVVLLNNLKLLVLQFVIGAPLSFLCAVLISAQGPRVRRFFKTASFLPAVLSVTVVCSCWGLMLVPQPGVIKIIMESIGLGAWYKPWTSLPDSFFDVVIFCVMWQCVGYNMLLFYSGMKSIPEHYFEAARLDGASMLQQVFCITLPLLQETLKYVCILMLTGTLSIVSQVQILANGAMLGEKTYSTVYYIYIKAFSQMDMGSSYALSVIYTIISFVAVLFVNRMIGKERLEYT